tara:strand:+ start:9725 stop:9964 length:240 start_codon:yes stop_codon:yes gene_type:complete
MSEDNRDIEDIYQQEMLKLTPSEKLERSFAMLQIHVQNIARQITEREGEMSEEELRWKVAEVLYQDDPGAIELMNQRHR